MKGIAAALTTISPEEELHNQFYQSITSDTFYSNAEAMIKATLDQFFKTNYFQNYVNNLADQYPKVNPAEAPDFIQVEKGPADEYTTFSFEFSNDLKVCHYIKINSKHQTDEVTFETEKRVIAGRSILTTTYQSDLIEPSNATIGSLVLEALHMSGIVETPSLNIMAYRNCMKVIPKIISTAFGPIKCQEVYNGPIINYDGLHYGSIYHVHHPETDLDFLVSPIVLLRNTSEEYEIYVEVIKVGSKEELLIFINKGYVDKLQIVCDSQNSEFPLKRTASSRNILNCNKDLSASSRFNEEKVFKTFVSGFSKLVIEDIHRHITKKRFDNLNKELEKCAEELYTEKFGKEDEGSED